MRLDHGPQRQLLQVHQLRLHQRLQLSPADVSAKASLTPATESTTPIALSVGRRERGAYFTPRQIAEFLAEWAIAGRPQATVLDPTCGDGAFLEAAGRQLARIGAPAGRTQLIGVDIDQPSLE